MLKFWAESVPGAPMGSESQPFYWSGPPEQSPTVPQKAMEGCANCGTLFLCDRNAPKAVCPGCGYVIVRGE